MIRRAAASLTALLCLTLSPPLAAQAPPGPAERPDAPPNDAAALPCKGVLLKPRTRGVPAGLRPVADAALRKALAATDCELSTQDAVDVMWGVLSLPRDAGAKDLLRLGRGLMARWVIVPALSAEDGKIRVVVASYYIASGQGTVTQQVVVPEQTLPALTAMCLKLAAQAPSGQVATPPPLTAPAPPVPGADQPQPTPGPPAQAPTPEPVFSRPADEPPPLPPPAPPRQAPPPVPPEDARPRARPAPRPRPGVSAGASPDPYGGRAHLMAGAGLKLFHVFSSQRVGPALEVELGLLRRNYRLGGLYRAYFGDTTAHMIGFRFEGGPRWGRFRLSLGADAGLVFQPDQGNRLDMVAINATLAAAAVQLWKLELQLTAFCLDVYVVPGNNTTGRELEAWVGFNSGLSAIFFL